MKPATDPATIRDAASKLRGLGRGDLADAILGLAARLDSVAGELLGAEVAVSRYRYRLGRGDGARPRGPELTPEVLDALSRIRRALDLLGLVEPRITCPKCKSTSYHPEDIRHGYCAACNAFTGEPGMPPLPSRGNVR